MSSEHLNRLKNRLTKQNESVSLKYITNLVQNETNNLLQSNESLPGEERLINRSKAAYMETRQLYFEFLALKNSTRHDEGLDDLEPWTKESYYRDLLVEFAVYRSITGKGSVEEKIQLGTIARELRKLMTIAKRENPILVLTELESQFVYTMLVRLSYQGAFGRKGKKKSTFGPQEAKILVETALHADKLAINIAFTFQVIVYILVVLYTGVRPSSLSKLDKDATAGFLQWKHVVIWRQGMDAMGFQLHVKLTIPHLKGRKNYYTEDQRVFSRTLVSQLHPGLEYDPLLDPVLFVICLGFKRGVFEFTSPSI